MSPGRDKPQIPETCPDRGEIESSATYYIDPSKKHEVTPSASNLLSSRLLAECK